MRCHICEATGRYTIRDQHENLIAVACAAHEADVYANHPLTDQRTIVRDVRGWQGRQVADRN